MSIEHHLATPIAAAVRLAGSQSAFARIVGRRQSTVYEWLSKGKALPAEHVLTVERAIGVSRHDLRPDIYPIDAPAPPPSLPQAVLSGGASHVTCDRSTALQTEVCR
jgi:DNA-binding transcriptional regulator YdaS (Cro superfamily)